MYIKYFDYLIILNEFININNELNNKIKIKEENIYYFKNLDNFEENFSKIKNKKIEQDLDKILEKKNIYDRLIKSYLELFNSDLNIF